MRHPILILGFERSGTTLVRRLISMHPSLKYDLLHEQWKIHNYQSADDAIKRYNMPVTQAGRLLGSIASVESGEKIAYNADSRKVLMYVDKWLKFWPQATLIHVVRDRHSVAQSCRKTFKRPRDVTLKAYDHSVETVTQYISQHQNTITVPYSILVEHPHEMTRCLYVIVDSLMPSESYIHRVITTQDPWVYCNRVMCGLRYKASVK